MKYWPRGFERTSALVYVVRSFSTMYGPFWFSALLVEHQSFLDHNRTLELPLVEFTCATGLPSVLVEIQMLSNSLGFQFTNEPSPILLHAIKQVLVVPYTKQLPPEWNGLMASLNKE